MDQLPKASAVLANIRHQIGSVETVQVLDYGHGLGAIRVSFCDFHTRGYTVLAASEEWTLVGSEGEDTDDVLLVTTTFHQWVMLDLT